MRVHEVIGYKFGYMFPLVTESVVDGAASGPEPCAGHTLFATADPLSWEPPIMIQTS